MDAAATSAATAAAATSAAAAAIAANAKIQSDLDLIMKYHRHIDDIASAGSILSGVLHCGRPLTITKNYAGALGALDAVVVEMDGFECFSPHKWEWYETRIAVAGQDKHDAWLALEDCKQGFESLKCVDLGLHQAGHKYCFQHVIEEVVKKSVPELCAMNDDVMMILPGFASDLRDVLAIVDRVFTTCKMDRGCDGFVRVYTVDCQPIEWDSTMCFGQEDLVMSLIREHRIAEEWSSLSSSTRRYVGQSTLDPQDIFSSYKTFVDSMKM